MLNAQTLKLTGEGMLGQRERMPLLIAHSTPHLTLRAYGAYD